MSVVNPPLKIVLPLTLEGSVVRLEPIQREHASCRASTSSGEIVHTVVEVWLMWA